MTAKEPIDYIGIIYNPNSTGNAKKLATQCKNDLKQLTGTVVLIPTKYAGHATELAKQISCQYKRPLIVSVSGDGGYNEVINGAMAARAIQKARPIVAVIGAGNANDHQNSVRKNRELKDIIVDSKASKLDLLHLESLHAGDRVSRYAHSYIGLGLTSVAGDALNNNGKSIFHELRAVVRSILYLRPIKIEYGNKLIKLDSLVFANVSRMAKVATLAKSSGVQDGKFEIIETKHRGKGHLLLSIVKLSLAQSVPNKSVKKYKFKLVRHAKVQFDGEIQSFKKGSRITITCDHHAIDSYFEP